ncbi:MAG: hypothetical protein J6O04_09400 [Selenomonadaceae bacterium]|nr:hypothetical protein [Selenomonadaceae bacterium]
MVSFSLDLDTEYARPTIILYGLLTLIDTGATVPVFSIPRNVVANRFRGVPIYTDKSFGGFGGGKIKEDIFSLSNFFIKQLHFKTIEVFVPHKSDIAYPLLFSSTMFLNVKYEIDPIDGKMNFKVPDENLKNNEFLIKNLSDKICVQLNGVFYQM